MTTLHIDTSVTADPESLREIRRLPQCDFYTRTIQDDANEQQTIDVVTSELKIRLQTMLQDATDKDFSNPTDEQIKEYIDDFEKQSKALEKRNPALSNQYKQYAKVTEDLLKISKLKALDIPGELTRPASTYCILAESAGGVTEKVSLISKATALNQLSNLYSAGPLSFDAYWAGRNDYQLSTEAIIKQPKHGEMLEVQREAIALNISRILNLDTTQSSMMHYKNQPVLFVPFDRIKLLSEYSTGQEFTALETRQTYQHYSTINPAAEGLQGDRFVDDFGAAFGLMYLCSDTDCIGGYNQNKALRNDRSLYVFDQVVMVEDKFKLDSRISLQPSQRLMMHTRHGLGRNRTVIEDSNISEKYQSMMNLIHNKDKILLYFSEIQQQYTAQIEVLNQTKPQGYEETIKKLTKLSDDVRTIKSAVIKRIDAIETVLPTCSEGLPPGAKLQAIILEKLVNRPVLFTEMGRPYKNPWTNRNDINIESASLTPSGTVEIHFKSSVSKEVIQSLIEKIPSLRITAATRFTGKANKIEMSQADFMSLQENMLHPEHNLVLQKNVNYLDIDSLDDLVQSYDTKYKDKVLSDINEYQKVMRNSATTPNDKIDKIIETQSKLKSHLDDAQKNNNSQGLVKHVLKKFQFDSQIQLQSLMPRDTHERLDLAFAAALKLDRSGLFNKVVAKAIQNNKIDSDEFIQFLQNCITKAGTATNHSEAKQLSAEIAQEGQECIEQFAPTHPIREVEDDFMMVDPIRVRETELSLQAPAPAPLAEQHEASSARVKNRDDDGRAQASLVI